MSRWHFYLMGGLAVVYGVVVMAEYVLISYGPDMGWLTLYPEAQLNWLAALPAWIHGTFGAHALLALVGGLCLITHVRSAVWMLGLAFIALLVVTVWAFLFATPTLTAVTGAGGTAVSIAALVNALVLLVYLYARGEKVRGGEL